MILERYQALNNSYRRKLVFNIGFEAGFYSEYNNMVLCMLYCLQNKVRFNLFSANANFRIDKGWTDYFLPFCDEDLNKLHARYNLRRPNHRGKENSNFHELPFVKRQIISLKNAADPVREKMLRFLYLKPVNRTDFFTHQLWDRFHSFDFQQQQFCIPELGIDGDIQHACSVLLGLTMRYNETTSAKVAKTISSLQLPADYLGFHIRRGDKIREYDYNKLEDYMRKAATLSDLRNAFVLTDDYQIIHELEKDHPDWNIYTLCDESEKGYDNSSFMQRDNVYKMDKMVKLFASMEMLAGADYFIGTYSSNPGMYMGMRMPKEKVHAVDFGAWRII